MKKLGAYLLAAVMLLTVVFGGQPSVQLEAASVDTPQNLKGSELGIGLADGTTATGMEIGDKVVVTIKATEDITDVYKIYGVFGYNKNCFSKLNPQDIQPLVDGGERVFSYGEDGLLHVGIDFDPEEAQTISKGTDILQITFTVKKATDNAVFTYNGVSIKTEAVSFVNGDYESDPIINSKADGRQLTIAMGDVEAHVDDEFEVPVKIGNNTGFNAVKIKVTYNSKVLSCNSIDLSNDMKAYAELQEVYERGGEIQMSVVASKDIKLTNKNMIVLKFDPLKAGSADVTVEVMGVSNESDVPMKGNPDNEPATAVSKITVKAALEAGDVNADGNVNLVDAAFILQYYNGIRELNAKEKERADVSNDGIVTLVDARMIMQEYNRE